MQLSIFAFRLDEFFRANKNTLLNPSFPRKSSYVNNVYNNVNMTNPIRNRRKNRRKRKGSNVKDDKNLVFMSCNAASINNKLLSLEKIVNDLNVSFFCLQETHVKKKGTINFHNSQNYQIYELNRESKNGGGLALGVLKELNPFWIKDGGNKAEAISVKFSIKELSICVTNAYGPK